MRAAWYDHRGLAEESLVVGQLPDPEPGAGEVRIRVAVSAISPGDVKKRAGWQGAPMPYPRVIPHSDGAGVIDAVGSGVSTGRIGEAVWCYGAQSYRPFGTAAEFVIVPAALAVPLPPRVNEADGRKLAEQSACLGIAGITGYRAVFAEGSVRGLTVLVHGAAGGVGSIAVQMARRDGAEVIAVVRDDQQQRRAQELGAHHAFLTDDADLVERIRAVAPAGVNRIAEVDLAAHIDLDGEVIATGGVICSYYSSADRPQIPYWTLGFADVTIRLLGSDDFSPAVKSHAANELTAALAEGALASSIAARLPLENIAHAHELVEQRPAGRVLLEIDTLD